MKIQKKKQSKKRIIIISIAILALVGIATGIYLFFIKDNDTQQETAKTENDNQKNKERSASDSGTAEQSEIDSSEEAPVIREEEKEIAPPYEGDNPNSSSSLSGAITYSATSGDMLILRTTINQVVVSGNCTATLTNGSKTVTKSSSIAQNPSSSTCEGFDIPLAELGSGNWNISIEARDNNNRSTILTGSVAL